MFELLARVLDWGWVKLFELQPDIKSCLSRQGFSVEKCLQHYLIEHFVLEFHESLKPISGRITHLITTNTIKHTQWTQSHSLHLKTIEHRLQVIITKSALDWRDIYKFMARPIYWRNLDSHSNISRVIQNQVQEDKLARSKCWPGEEGQPCPKPQSKVPKSWPPQSSHDWLTLTNRQSAFEL